MTSPQEPVPPHVTDFRQAPPRRRWLRCVSGMLAACTLATAAQASAAARDSMRHDLVIAVADDGETTRRAVADLRRRFAHALVVDAGAGLPRRRLVVAVGPAALRAALAGHGAGPVISIFTSSQVYHSIIEAAGESRPPSTAIYAEPAPGAQLRLIARLFRRPVHTTVVLSGRTAFLEPALQQAADAARVKLAIAPYAVGASIGRVLDGATHSPAILLVPDSLVYTSDNLRTVLLNTYRNEQAVIGFSAALVHAGALATTYSEVEDVNAQLEELIDEYGGAQLPAPRFPKYFRTVINEDVARSLNLALDDTVRNFSHRPPRARR